MIIDRILPIYMSLMLICSLSFIVHLEAILNLWMKNYLCTVFWRFVSKEEAMEPNLICYIRTSRGLFGASMGWSTMTILWWYRVYEYRITKENCGELAPLQITPSTPSLETQGKLIGTGYLGA